MSKLAFINKVKWVREAMKDVTWYAEEIKRWAKLADKHGLRLLGYGTPWGNDYHTVSMYVTENGLDAWNAFSSDVLRNGTPDAWKYIEDFSTDIVSLS